MDYFELLRHRRSNRRFTREQISDEELSSLLLAANAAPVGSAMYGDIHLTVVQNRGILQELSLAAMQRSRDKAELDKIRGKLRAAGEQSVFDPFYGAPTVIFVSHRRQKLQPGIEFSNVACVTYSMHLAASELGLCSVFSWYALESMRMLPELDRSSLLQLPEDFEALLGLSVGHFVHPPREREIGLEKISVNYIR